MPRRRISATIDEGWLRRLDEEARKLDLERSRALEECIKAWLSSRQHVLMAQGYLEGAQRDHLMAEEDLPAQLDHLPDW